MWPKVYAPDRMLHRERGERAGRVEGRVAFNPEESHYPYQIVFHDIERIADDYPALAAKHGREREEWMTRRTRIAAEDL